MSAPKFTRWVANGSTVETDAPRGAPSEVIAYGIDRDDHAHLIAAAPDLYAALKETIEAVTFVDVRIPKKLRREFDRALAALAKARGES